MFLFLKPLFILFRRESILSSKFPFSLKTSKYSFNSIVSDTLSDNFFPSIDLEVGIFQSLTTNFLLAKFIVANFSLLIKFLFWLNEKIGTKTNEVIVPIANENWKNFFYFKHIILQFLNFY